MKILVTDHFSSNSLFKLKQVLGAEIIRTGLLPDSQLLTDIDALLIRSRTKIDQKFLENCPNLKIIVSATSGFDHIDLAACKSRQIQLFHTPDAQIESAAELTILLMLSCLRRWTEVQKTLQSFRWKEELNPGCEMRSKTVGIIGLGRVGSRVTQIVRAFGANVIAHDPFQPDTQFEQLNLNRLGLTEVFVQSDILTLHVPLTRRTRHLICAQTIELLPENCILINTSRGPVIDEGDLLRALESGRLAGAGLDVFEHEPLGKEARIRNLKNIVLTPHIGAYTKEAFDRASEMAVESLIQFVSNKVVLGSIYDSAKFYQIHDLL